MVAHLQHDHYTGQRYISPDELAITVDLCDRPVDISKPVQGQKCILCQEPVKYTKTFQEHLAAHMEDVALFVLPNSADVDAGKNGASNDSLQVAAKGKAKRGQYDFGSNTGSLDFSETQSEHAQDPTALSKQLLDEESCFLVSFGNQTIYQYDSTSAGPWASGQWDKTEERQLQIVEMTTMELGAEHPDTLTSMVNLALRYGSQERWEEAGTLWVQVVESQQKILGDEHPDTLFSMARLAFSYRRQGRLAEAKDLEAQVLQTGKKTLGDNYPDKLFSTGLLASEYGSQGRWVAAEHLGVRVLQTRKERLGEEHPDTLTSIRNVAAILKYQGQNTDALELMEHCVEAQQRVLSPNHSDTILALGTLSQWRRASG